jgi:hypothetical protein
MKVLLHLYDARRRLASPPFPCFFPDTDADAKSLPCFLEKRSLFEQQNSLFAGVGNFGRKCLIQATLMVPFGP